jgi:hypothetical protein
VTRHQTTSFSTREKFTTCPLLAATFTNRGPDLLCRDLYTNAILSQSGREAGNLARSGQKHRLDLQFWANANDRPARMAAPWRVSCFRQDRVERRLSTHERTRSRGRGARVGVRAFSTR